MARGLKMDSFLHKSQQTHLEFPTSSPLSQECPPHSLPILLRAPLETTLIAREQGVGAPHCLRLRKLGGLENRLDQYLFIKV